MSKTTQIIEKEEVPRTVILIREIKRLLREILEEEGKNKGD